MQQLYKKGVERLNSAPIFIDDTAALNIFELHYGIDILWNALYLLAGGIWYLLLTMLLYSFRPYKATKQMLGELVQNMAHYLEIRASFYDPQTDQDAVYNALFQSQVKV